jgi:hypothetical protein
MENKGFLLHRYGHFSGINRKVQMKYQPKGRPRGSSSDDGKDFVVEHLFFLLLLLLFTTTTTAAAAINNSNNIRAVSIVIAFLPLCIRVSKISQPCCDVTSPCSLSGVNIFPTVKFTSGQFQALLKYNKSWCFLHCVLSE